MRWGCVCRMKLELTTDRNNQWFVPVWVSVRGRKVLVRFKVDSGCNALVLSHRTLNKLGVPTDRGTLSKLPEIPGALASGATDTFNKLGEVSLYQDSEQTGHIGKFPAICHATRQTHDLLGTGVLGLFDGITINLKGSKYMELVKE